MTISPISFTNKIEQFSLFLYRGELSDRIAFLNAIETQVLSRISGLLTSPAALLELSFHLAILPFAASLGRESPHIQRIRDAVFPIFFGSLLGLIHPYLGAYAAEPAKKHVAGGILLSRTDKKDFHAVCSPLTAFEEIKALKGNLTPLENALLDDVLYWEGEFEKVQSIDFFSLNLTSTFSNLIVKRIEDAQLPRAVKEAAKRAAAFTALIFIAGDLIALMLATLVCLGASVVHLAGGQSPAYLEKACSFEVALYNLIKIPLTLISSTVGMIISLVNPKSGHSCMSKPLEEMAYHFFKAKMSEINSRLKAMETKDCILLPAAELFPDGERGELPLLPSFSSHMRYLLVEKLDDNVFRTELIERGKLHGVSALLNRKAMEAHLESILSRRFIFFQNRQKELSLSLLHYETDSLIDLGDQGDFKNCVITNFFAVIEVVRHRNKEGGFKELCADFRKKAFSRYEMYLSDFHPFGKKEDILQEIKANLNNPI